MIDKKYILTIKGDLNEEKMKELNIQKEAVDKLISYLPVGVRLNLLQYLKEDFENLELSVKEGDFVRCKDCIYKPKAKTNKKGFLICKASGMEICDDDFCSYGERKGGIDNG